MKKLSVFTLLSGAMLLSACTYSAIGMKPAAKAPQLVNSTNQQGVAWNSRSAFGPVPASLQLKGDMVCRNGMNVMTSTAIGYHPNALDKAGKPMLGGGYLCSKG